MTKIFLSSLDNGKEFWGSISDEAIFKSKYVLFSYFYARKFVEQKRFAKIMQHYNKRDSLLLDSGAFSFMNSKKITEQKLDDYCEQYVAFIKKYHIKRFVELDIDPVFGFKKALDYRKYIEKETNRQCIPIFHKSRGKKEFINMVEKYDYAGVGGIAIKNIKKSEYKYFFQLNLFANKRHCKLHAMGFTPGHDLLQYGFYSSDSASWSTATHYGQIYYFKNGRVKTYRKPKHKRVILDYPKIHTHNWLEWCKYQRFCDR